VCYSSNASFQTNSDTAASIGLLLCFWQVGGAILNFGGLVLITGSEFIDNTASDGNTSQVSHGLCTLSSCVLFFKCFISN
jgi:hypothetical protein